MPSFSKATNRLDHVQKSPAYPLMFFSRSNVLHHQNEITSNIVLNRKEKNIVSIFEICQLLTNHETPTKLQRKDKKRENNISNKSLIALHLFDYSLERRLIENFKSFFFCHLYIENTLATRRLLILCRIKDKPELFVRYAGLISPP